jgi:hypothetical protein
MDLNACRPRPGDDRHRPIVLDDSPSGTPSPPPKLGSKRPNPDSRQAKFSKACQKKLKTESIEASKPQVKSTRRLVEYSNSPPRLVEYSESPTSSAPTLARRTLRSQAAAKDTQLAPAIALGTAQHIRKIQLVDQISRLAEDVSAFYKHKRSAKEYMRTAGGQTKEHYEETIEKVDEMIGERIEVIGDLTTRLRDADNEAINRKLHD